MTNVFSAPAQAEELGDLSSNEFRQFGHQIVDWIADYLVNLEKYPVLSQVEPGQIRSSLPAAAPEEAEPMERILRDFDQLIMPGVTHWNHPAFFAYFAITASAPGILADMLSSALNNNSMLWRTSPASTELEETVMDWLRQLLGLPDAFTGLIYDTASISSLVALTAARQAADPLVRTAGLAGRTDLAPLTLYCSEQAHSSIDKAAVVLGIGTENIRKIPTDAAFRMDEAALERAIETDRAAGLLPFAVVATVGTTSTTSVDPVRSIAAVTGRHGIWLHVDAAYGGAAALLPEMRSVFDGVDAADSVLVNPHKWLFTPFDLSALYTRRDEAVREAFSLVAEYLRTAETVRNHMDYGPQLGRRFRSLKLWFVLRAFGAEGVRDRLRQHIRLARLFAGWVESSEGWELMAPVPFSTVCFRATVPNWTEAELDNLNQRILDGVNAGGEVFLSHTRLHGKLTPRLAIGNLHTQQRHVERAWELLDQLRSATCDQKR